LQASTDRSSTLRREVNRRNALASTGPITRSGKFRVRRNALKHGLAAGPLAQKFPQRKVDALVEALVGSCCNPAIRDAAAQFAIAHLNWLKVAAVHQKILDRKLRDLGIRLGSKGQGDRNQAIMLSMLTSDPELVKIERYERRAFSRRRRAALGLQGH
jgi:hypothetical protein